MMKNSAFHATILLFFTAMIWGLSYSAQAEAMDTMKPLWFVSLRYLLAAAVLAAPIFIMKKPFQWQLIPRGAACGFFLAGGEIIQQFGLLYTTAGKAGFLTALYVIMIPVIGVFIKRKSNWLIWCASVISVAGAYLLCSDGTISSFGNLGDVLMLLCALFFAFQFIALAEFAPDADAFQLAAVQFLTVAVISGVAAPIAGESCSLLAIKSTLYPLLFCGIIAIGFACTVQVAAQKYVHPATASIILSTASVFALLWGWLLRGETYSLINLAGCVLIFAAVIIVELSAIKKQP